MSMNPLQIQVFLNEINDEDDEDTVLSQVLAFSDQVNMEAVERWDVDNEPPETWKKFEQLWLNTYFPWISKGNGILLMWSKDSDNVYPYVWWYIGFNKKRKLFESSSWLLSGEFYDDKLGVVKAETCNWNGFNLSDLTEQVAAKMLEFTSDWDGELPEDSFVVWANCATGLNLWKTSFNLEELMRKTLNWSNADLEILLG